MVVDARAAARRIVEQVLADHAVRTGSPAVPARPAVPDSPAWRAARRIVDEVLAAQGEGLVPAVQGATLADVVDGPALPLAHLEQATEEGTAQTVGRIVRRATGNGDDPAATVQPDRVRPAPAGNGDDPAATVQPDRVRPAPAPTAPVPTGPGPAPSASGPVESAPEAPVELSPPAAPSPAPAPPAPSPAPAPPAPSAAPAPPPVPSAAPLPEAEAPSVVAYGGDVDAPAVVARRIVAEVLAATVPPPVRPQPPIEPPRPLEPPRPPVEPQPLPPIEPDPRPHEPDPRPHEPEPDPEPGEPEPEPVGAAPHPAEPMDGPAPIPSAAPVATISAGPTVRRDDEPLVASEPVEWSGAPRSDAAPAPPPKRTGRWLLATLLGAIALAWLFPLAVGALRDLVRLSS